jgi:hypothetical protein
MAAPTEGAAGQGRFALAAHPVVVQQIKPRRPPKGSLSLERPLPERPEQAHGAQDRTGAGLIRVDRWRRCRRRAEINEMVVGV